MRVVTWNVQHARPNPDGPADVGAVVDALRRLGGDVWALQELDRGRRRSDAVDQPGGIAAALGGTLAWGPTVHDRGEYGIAVVAAADLITSRQIDLGGTREPRALLVVELDHGGRRWTVGCTHLSRRAAFAQDQLARALDVLSQHPAPRVLVGDLNLVPAEVLPWSSAAGFEMVTGPPTHSTRRRRPKRRIDHILVSGARIDEASVHRFGVSDHCAVVADLA